MGPSTWHPEMPRSWRRMPVLFRRWPCLSQGQLLAAGAGAAAEDEAWEQAERGRSRVGTGAGAVLCRPAGTSLPTPSFSPDAAAELVPGARGHLETLADSSQGPARDNLQHFGRAQTPRCWLLLCPACPQWGLCPSSHKTSPSGHPGCPSAPARARSEPSTSPAPAASHGSHGVPLS